MLPAQPDSAREKNPKLKTSEEESATIYLTPIHRYAFVAWAPAIPILRGGRKTLRNIM